MAYYILDGKKVKSVSMSEWLIHMSDREKGCSKEDRRVGWTEVCPGVEISTVFLFGIDHNFLSFRYDKDSVDDKEDSRIPLLFETMIFAKEFPELDQKMFRYAMWKDAEDGHEKTVELVKQYLHQWKSEQSDTNDPLNDQSCQ